ncbi:hypothetical protein NL676_000562 [Syzygium grande]|nr:hypothetical protein NL676_000562 [Syzygium grande]
MEDSWASSRLTRIPNVEKFPKFVCQELIWEMSKAQPPEPLDFFIWTVEDVGRKCHMKWGDFITLCKELRRIKVACLKGDQKVRRLWWAPSCLSIVSVKSAKRSRQSRVVSLKAKGRGLHFCEREASLQSPMSEPDTYI